MARVYKSCNVERMGAILREFCSDRLVGLKKEDKAALIVEKVPRARLMEILAGGAQEPVAKRAKRGSVQAASNVAPRPNRTLAEFFEAPNAVVNQGAEQARPGLCAQMRHQPWATSTSKWCQQGPPRTQFVLIRNSPAHPRHPRTAVIPRQLPRL